MKYFGLLYKTEDEDSVHQLMLATYKTVSRNHIPSVVYRPVASASLGTC